MGEGFVGTKKLPQETKEKLETKAKWALALRKQVGTFGRGHRKQLPKAESQG